MILDTRLLDIITDSLLSVGGWLFNILFSLFSDLMSLYPLFLVSIIISLIFVIIKIIRKFIWGV